MEHSKTKKLIIASITLIIICIICLLVTIRYAEKYNMQYAQINELEQELSDLNLNYKNLDFKKKELEARRYSLSLEKQRISNDYLSIKKEFSSFEKTIKSIEHDMNTLKEIVNGNKSIVEGPGNNEVDGDSLKSGSSILKSQNGKLLSELTKKTREKMILEIALTTHAKKLGILKKHNPDLNELLKQLLKSLQ